MFFHSPTFLWNIIFLSVKSKLVDIKILAESHIAAVQGERVAVNLLCIVLSFFSQMAKHIPGVTRINVFHCKRHFWKLRNCWLFYFLSWNFEWWFLMLCDFDCNTVIRGTWGSGRGTELPDTSQAMWPDVASAAVFRQGSAYTASSSELGSCKGHTGKTYLWCCWPSEFYPKIQNCIGWTLWHFQFLTLVDL